MGPRAGQDGCGKFILSCTQIFSSYLTENTVRIRYKKTNLLIIFREIIVVFVLNFMGNKFIVLKIQPFVFYLKAALNFRNQCPLHGQINEVGVFVSRNLFSKCFERKMLR